MTAVVENVSLGCEIVRAAGKQKVFVGHRIMVTSAVNRIGHTDERGEAALV